MKRATSRCLGVFAKLIFNALKAFNVSSTVWEKRLKYPQSDGSHLNPSLDISLHELAQSEDAIYLFLCTLYAQHVNGSPLFIAYGARNETTVLTILKKTAWKIVLPVELARALICLLYTSDAADE